MPSRTLIAVSLTFFTVLICIISIYFWVQSLSGFTDVLSQKISPDGRVIAAYVMEAHGPMAGVAYGLTITTRSRNPLSGHLVLLESDDDEAIKYKWNSNTELEVRLPCSVYSQTIDNLQVTNNDKPINIIYTPERDDCLIQSDGYFLKPAKR